MSQHSTPSRDEHTPPEEQRNSVQTPTGERDPDYPPVNQDDQGEPDDDVREALGDHPPAPSDNQ